MWVVQHDPGGLVEDGAAGQGDHRDREERPQVEAEESERDRQKLGMLCRKVT